MILSPLAIVDDAAVHPPNGVAGSRLSRKGSCTRPRPPTLPPSCVIGGSVHLRRAEVCARGAPPPPGPVPIAPARPYAPLPSSQSPQPIIALAHLQNVWGCEMLDRSPGGREGTVVAGGGVVRRRGGTPHLTAPLSSEWVPLPNISWLIDRSRVEGSPLSVCRAHVVHRPRVIPSAPAAQYTWSAKCKVQCFIQVSSSSLAYQHPSELQCKVRESSRLQSDIFQRYGSEPGKTCLVTLCVAN